MLTATYTLVALSIEQSSVRLSLLSFQKYVRSTLMQQNSMTLSQLEYACENLNSLYQACHWRKTEMYLIPAIREATERADALLDELNRLNQSALLSIRMLQEKLGSLADVRDEQVSQMCDSIESFCTSLLRRLEKEEHELFAHRPCRHRW
jgi:hemerythrin-like domain-containing protein